jgi:hypothetical protein
VTNDEIKYVSQIMNAHKIGNILVPLIEAVEINHKTEMVDGADLNKLFQSVIETGGRIFETLSDNKELSDTSQMSDKLFIALAKSLRNSVVLFNSTSLQMMESEIMDVFDDNAKYISSFCEAGMKDIGNRAGKMSEVERVRMEMDVQGHVIGSLSKMFMPIWLFHTSLRTANVIKDTEKLLDLNIQASSFFFEILDKMVGKIVDKEDKHSSMFYLNGLSMSADLITSTVHEFNAKLIKNKKQLNQYIEEPESILTLLIEPISANFSAMNKVTKSILAKSS